MLSRAFLVFAAICAAVAISPPARAQAEGDAPVQIQAFSPEKTQRLGRAMYLEDQAAWRATDLLEAAKIDRKGIFGWVAAPTDNGVRVRFLTGSSSAPKPAYDVVFGGGAKPTLTPSTDTSLTEDEASQLRALNTAAGANLARCSERPPNHIELRDPDTGEWLVWFLTPWLESGVPFGGHTRVTVSPDGERILRTERMANSCLTMPFDPKKKPPMIMVSQLVADSPLETHVFNALQTGVPIAIVMPDGYVWTTDGSEIERIAHVDDPPENAKGKRR